MLWHILKKDIKRKKTMNIIMLLFIILASMFVASGLNNVITISNGTDYFFNTAGMGDYIATRKNAEGVDENFETILSTIPEAKSYRIEEAVYTSKDSFKKPNGEKIKYDNTILIQSLEDSGLNFFYSDNSIAKSVEKGHFYASNKFASLNNIKVGDQLVINGDNDYSLTVTYDGNLKDALFGSDMISNARIYLSREDYTNYRDNGVTHAGSVGEIAYIDSDDINTLDVELSKKCSNLLFARPRSVIKMAYVMNMIVAFITLILSVCLIIVSFVILKFTISFTITEEYREIGVMKAIGIKNNKIRVLYVIKYLAIALVGSLVGFGLSFPFGSLLLKSVTESMVLGNSLGAWPNILGSLVVILSILGFAYLATGVVKKATPIDAIRNGQTGERFKKKAKLKLSHSKTNTAFFMAANDVLSSKKKYLTIASVFALCTAFVLVLTNTVTTMKSDNLIDSFAAPSDLYYKDEEKLMSFMSDGGNERLDEYIADTEKDLKDLGMPGKVFVDAQFIFKITSGGEEYSISCQQGKHTTTDMYSYTQGTAPQNMYEIAITSIISKKINAHIGDTVTIDYGTGPVEATVTAYFTSMNLLGEVIRIHEDAPTDLKSSTSWMMMQINFDDHPSNKVLKERKEKLIDYLDGKEVLLPWEFQMDCISVVPTMEIVQKLLLAITLIVVVLVVVLMERSFISDEKSEIAILKAVGFKDWRIILYHVLRFLIVTVFAVILAGAVSIPLTYLAISPIFGMMGMTNMTYTIDPIQIFVIYPLIILVATLLIAFITALYTKTIKSSDTASIE